MRGEDITYFSPFRSFAKEALLTRCDGQSAIEWEAQRPNAVDGIAQFKFLIGFSILALDRSSNIWQLVQGSFSGNDALFVLYNLELHK